MGGIKLHFILPLIVCTGCMLMAAVTASCSESAEIVQNFNVEEDKSIGSNVGYIGENLNSSLGPPYSDFLFTEDLIKQTFEIDYNSGLIRTKERLDRETTEAYSFYILKVSIFICINVTVLDVNDIEPRFFRTKENPIKIPEGAPHHKISLGSAVDDDIGSNTIKDYKIKSGNDDHAFNLTGRYSSPQKLLLDLGINGTLDYETTPSYQIVIEISDGGTPAMSTLVDVDIEILDTNDNQPIFNQSKYSAAILENATVGTSVLEVHATDLDSGENGKVHYSIDRNTDPDQNFRIDPVTGVIYINKKLDYETKNTYKLFAIASDSGNQSNPTPAVVEIEVLNINELPANIDIKYVTTNSTPRIPENASAGYNVVRVSVSDPEAADTDSTEITVTLQGGEGHFRLQNTGSGTYALLVDKQLDRETKDSYDITLIADDSGSPPLSAKKSFTLYIDDVNDNPPQFAKQRYEAEVQEMLEAGNSVLLVTATDPDLGNNRRISYHIRNSGSANSEWFQVDSNSGLITTSGQVDCEVDSHPSFILVATDHGSPPLSSSTTVVVSVRDINDKEPTFDQSLYTAEIPEDTMLYHCILQVNATDPDCGVNGEIKYFISNDSVVSSNQFYIEQGTGRVCIGKKLDHETTPLFEFSVIAKDTGNFATTANIQISLTDINDNEPVFYPRNYSKNIPDNLDVNAEIITVQASDADSGAFGHITYKIISGNTAQKFKIDPVTGSITLQHTLGSGQQLYKLMIDADDDGGLSAIQKAEVHISVTGPDSSLPQFERSMYRFTVSESVGLDTPIGVVKATYEGQSTGIRYTITSGDQNSFFKVDPVTGVVRSAKPLDHDEYPSLLLNIMADVGNNFLMGTSQVNITVTDINDNIPMFSSDHVTTSISEAIDSMVTIYSAHATDKDSRANGNGEVRYSLEANLAGLFAIEATSGEVHLADGAKLDYEKVTQHALVIVAHDQGQNVQLSSSMTLTINVQDVNDQPPVFAQDLFVGEVSEAVTISSSIMSVSAGDSDSGENGRITYRIVEPDIQEVFGIFPSNGQIYLRDKLDREFTSLYTFTVIAKDHGQPSKTATASVKITVIDDNDNPPVFVQSEYRFTVEEHLPSGTSVGHVSATDNDIGNNALLQYDFLFSQDDFTIENDGILRTGRSLDRELNKDYAIEVVVQDSGAPILQSTVMVYITVADINDHAPVIQNSQFSEQVDENRSKGLRVVKIVAKDPDAGENGTITYALDGDEDSLRNFAIDAREGWITTKEVLDHEVKDVYRFKVIAYDSGSPPKSTNHTFEIFVNDDNDGAPIFPQNINITFYIVENTPTGTAIGQVQAHDNDGGENGRISYYITGGNHFGLFSVDMATGIIYSIREIDYEESSSHTVRIKAIDNSIHNPKSSVITIKIFVIDVNDNAPVFEYDPVFLTVKENTPIGTVVHVFTATDKDTGNNGTVKYEIINSTNRKLEVDPYTGQLRVIKEIDYEDIRDIAMIVKAYDQAPTPQSQLFTTLTVMILVVDENDNAPEFQNYLPFEVQEDEPLGYKIASIIATDADGNVNKSGNNMVTYSIKTGNAFGAFSIDKDSGALTIAAELDRETVSTYTLQINARDQGVPYLESEVTIVIKVLDVNDNAPQFLQITYQANVTENSVIGTLITKISAEDDDEGVNSQLRYMIPDGIANDYFSIDPVTGLITLVTDDLDRETQSSYIFTANVQDGGNPVLYDTATLIINVTDENDNAPMFKESQYFLEIPENSVQDDIYVFVAHDPDIGDNARVQYSITGGNNEGKFSIQSDTGALSCKQPLDRELVSDYELTINATDRKYTSTCTLFIKVKDQNDNDPVFIEEKYSEIIYENVIVGTLVVMVSAGDLDEGENGKVSYSLSNDPDASMFEVDGLSGEIRTKGLFDREKKASYSFDVIANDGGQYDSRSEKVRLDVIIGDINDNPPVFQEVPYRKNVSQGMGANVYILDVTAEDKDAGVNGQVSYRFSTDTDQLSLNYFKIDEATGEVKTKRLLESGALGYHNLKVIARDNGGLQSQLSSTGIVEITVGSSSGGQTLQFRNQNYSTSLHEHARVGSRVITVELVNKLSGVTFSFASGNEGNAYQISSSGEISVQNSDPIDYEVTQSMRLIVAAVMNDVYAYTTVWVNLIDINDNKPIFSQDRYVTKVEEEQDKSTYVMQVTATDADSSSRNTDIVYNIIQGNHDEAFIIKPAYSGLIRTNLIVDYEIRKSYKLIIEAKDNGENGSLSSTCTVRISVIDTNDNPPKFPDTMPVNTSEAKEVGSSITLVTANDVDISPPVTYSFSNQGNPDGMFSIDHYNGLIRLAKPLDHERRNHYTIGLQAFDGEHKDFTTLDIYVTDENDNSPVFSKQSYQVSIEEFTPKDRSVVRVNATDADSGLNAQIRYSLTVAPSTGFYIDPISGVIYTNETVHYRQNQEIIQLVVMATDSGAHPLSTVVAVYIQITSVNKYPPKFLKSSYSTSVNEDAEKGFIIMHVEATDNDTAGRNKEIDYSIVAGNTDNVFGIDQKHGRIILNGQLDRETMIENNLQVAEYNLLVMAKDRGYPSRNDTVNVLIVVQDVNDQVPYFEFGEYFVTLNESYPNEPSFLTINAYDNDEGAHAKIYFTITSGNEEGLFIANGITGQMYITPNESLDYETNTIHKLVVRATDCNGCEPGSPRFSNITIVHVTVTDVNEFAPVFPVDIYVEGVNESMPIGSSVFEAHANDKDGELFGTVTYTIQGTNKFSINAKTGLVTTDLEFDYETAIVKEHRFYITAVDNGGKNATIETILHLVDVDEYEPVFDIGSYAFDIPGSAVNGTYIGRVKATDRDGGNAGVIVYRFNPPQKYFGINSSTGEIRVIHDLNREIADKEMSRRKREINSLLIEASSGMDDSRSASVFMDIDVDRTCAGCEMMYIETTPSSAGSEPVSIALIVIVVVSVLAVCLIVIILVILLRYRRHSKTPPPSETPMYDNDEFDTLPHTQGAPPPLYGDIMNRFGGGNHTVHLTTSSDMSGHSHHSGSSGRGSAEDDEDEELAMINSTSPYLNNSNGFRKTMPDSGIQDDDNTSEPSVQNHQDYLARLGIDTEKINSKAKSGGLTHSVESMHQFSDSGGGEGDGLEMEVDYTKLTNTQIDHHDGLMVDKPNGVGYHEQEPHMSGSLSNVINSEEEYSGSYNWDYLLDWGPQYQPLAHVFSEIARLKDDNIQPKKQVVQIVPQQRQILPSVHAQVRTVPPPMITNAPPKAIPHARSNRSSHSSGGSNLNSARNSTINTSLPSMPRSPISHESSFTSPALTPSFTPSLSPLATRSPSVSPVNSGRGMGSSNHSSGPNTPRGRPINNNNKFGFGSSSSEQELQI